MAAITLVQYGAPKAKETISPPCGKIHMALRFKGLEYQVKTVKTPGEAKKFNPRGRVPALVIDGAITVDSTDIMTELDRLFPEPPLLPVGRRERAEALVLEDWADEVLYFYLVYERWLRPANMARLKALLFKPMAGPLAGVVAGFARREVQGRLRGQGVALKPPEVVARELRAALDALEGLLEGRRFLVADTLTRADISVCAVTDQMRAVAFTPELAAEVEGRSAIVAWSARVHERAAPALSFREARA